MRNPARDTLYLNRPEFADPQYPGQRFFCWHCALLEGLLATFPELAAELDIVHVDWPRPRQDIIAIVGEQNQSLPLLVLADGHPSAHETGRFERRRFIATKDGILAALAERHGFPIPHP